MISFAHDKARSLFKETENRTNKILKAKIIALSMSDIKESATTYYTLIENQLPAHFILDEKNIIKYSYSTTNVFRPTMEWEPLKGFIEPRASLGEATIGSQLKVTKTLITKQDLGNLTPDTIVLYEAPTDYHVFFKLIAQSNDDIAYHYLVDDKNVYMIYNPKKIAHHISHPVHETSLSVVMLTKNKKDLVYQRTAKFIKQLQEQFNIITFAPCETYEANHYYKLTNFANLEERYNQEKMQYEAYEKEEPVAENKDSQNPGEHIIHLTVLYDNNQEYKSVEKKLIQFLGDYLVYHQLDTSSLWRLDDLVVDKIHSPYYNAIDDFNKLLANVEYYIEQIKAGAQHIEIVTTGLPHKNADGEVIISPFSPDLRNYLESTYFLTSSENAIAEDYYATTIGSDIACVSKFREKKGYLADTLSFVSCGYEPVYPDLTVPPRTPSILYDDGIIDSLKVKEKLETASKVSLGKIVNAFDPYPIDEKIAQLEMHFPIVTLEYEETFEVQNKILEYTINRFGNAEKRIVRLENILATQMRYLARLSSRMNINCVYYGGQSTFDKYNCIRCLCDDLVNDAGCVSLDQCLNCSRYQPVLGQIYDISSDKHQSGVAHILDTVQSSYMTKEYYAALNRIDNCTEEQKSPTQDLSKLGERQQDHHDFETYLKEANNFVMDWSEVEFHKQSPHINIYEYDLPKLYAEKDKMIEDIYEDGYKEQKQLTFERPHYGMNTIGHGNFQISESGGGILGYHNFSDYDYNADDLRLKILSLCQEAVDLGSEGKFLYTLGAIIKRSAWKYSPKELYQEFLKGTVVNEYVEGYESYHQKDDPLDKAIYVDCSSLASYIYGCCGLITSRFTSSSLVLLQDFQKIHYSNLTLLENLKYAIPGDILLYKGHVSIYAGLDKEYEASTDKVEKTKQIALNIIKNKSDFIGIYRHKSLSVPTLKSVTMVPIECTLEEFITIEQGKNSGIDVDNNGIVDIVKDGAYITDRNILQNYIDPSKRLTPELKLQFASIKNDIEPGTITAQMLNDYIDTLTTRKVQALKIDSNYEPIRDKEGNFIWEEKYEFPRGEIWLEAAKRSNLNPLFLIAHCAGETGWCHKSNFANHSKKIMSSDKQNYLFNAYGLWCYDRESFPNDPALHFAEARKKCEAEQWFSLEKAVIEGSVYIANIYLGEKAIAKYGRRDTPYFMKWHFGSLIKGQEGTPATMQYATDVTWADQRAKIFYAGLEFAPNGRDKALLGFKYYLPKFKEYED